MTVDFFLNDKENLWQSGLERNWLVQIYMSGKKFKQKHTPKFEAENLVLADEALVAVVWA